jgi:hypothetical protein
MCLVWLMDWISSVNLLWWVHLIISISTKVHDLKVLPLGKANINLGQGNLSMVHGVTHVWHKWIQKPITMLSTYSLPKVPNNNLLWSMYVKGSKNLSIHSSPIHRDKYNSLFSITDQLHGAYSCSYETFLFSTLNWPKALCARRFLHISNKLILTCFLYYKLARNA